MTSSSNEDDEIIKEVFRIRQSLSKTQSSIEKLNRLSSSNKTLTTMDNDSAIMPPPLTMDDLGHNDMDLRPIDESVLRQWNLNASQKSSLNNSKSRYESLSARASISENSAYKHKLPQTSSPNDRFKALGARAFSCSNLPSSSSIMDVVEADSYRMIKQPSFISYKTISPAKSTSSHGHSTGSRSFEALDADVSIPLHTRSQESTPSKSILKENVTPRPYSSRSNATTVTLLGTDAESDRLRQRLSAIRRDNEHLNDVVSDLKQTIKSQKKEFMQNEKQTSLKIEHLSERNEILREEKTANDEALRKAEDALQRIESELRSKNELVSKLRGNLSDLQTSLKKANGDKLQAINDQKEAYNDAQIMAEKLERAHEEIKTLSDRRDNNHMMRLNAMNAVNEKLTNENRKLNERNNEIKEKLREASSLIDSLRRNESDLRDKYERSSSSKRDFTEELNKKKDELTDCRKQIEVITSQQDDLRERSSRLTERNEKQTELLLSCQQELEDLKTKNEKLEKELTKKLKNEEARVSSPAPHQQISKDVQELRSVRSEFAECKLRLESKQSMIERLESRVRSLTQESDRLEDIRTELVNVVERSRMGENRAKELESIIRSLEDERSKVTRQLMDCRDKINDQQAEIESLEVRLKERTNKMLKHETSVASLQQNNNDMKSDITKLKSELQRVKDDYIEKCSECTQQVSALAKLTQEITESRRVLDNATEWTGKREMESRKEIERVKIIHAEQHKEMEQQIENLVAERNSYRNQMNTLKCELCRLRDAEVAASNRINSLDHEIACLTEQASSEQLLKESKLKELQTKAEASSEQVVMLETTLNECKNEISGHVDRINDLTSKFNHQLAMKSTELTKIGSELKMCQESLNHESQRATSAEDNLNKRQQMFDDANQRVNELERIQSALDAKISALERELCKRDTSSKLVAEETKKQLLSAMHELDAKNQQFDQLNNALKDVDHDFTTCREELLSMEEQLRSLTNQSQATTEALNREKAELKITKEQLQGKIEEVVKVQASLDTSERSRMNSEEKCLELETEFARCQATIEGMSRDVGRFEASLESKDIEMMQKESLIARMRNALREAQGIQASHGCRYEELEKMLQEKDWNLQQKVTMVTKLEMELADANSRNDKLNIESKSEAKKLELELKARNKQLETLDEQLSDLRHEVSEARHNSDRQGQEVNRFKQEIDQKAEQIHELEKSLLTSQKTSEERHTSYLRVCDELRQAQSQLNDVGEEWKRAQSELSRLQKQQKILVEDLHAISHDDQNKDEQVSKLTAKLASCLNEKDSIEKRYMDELERLRKGVTKIHKKHDNEIMKLKSIHNEEINQMKQADASDELLKALDRENQSRMQLDNAQQMIAQLERELLARKQVIEAANETIVAKVAEIAQLEAKLNEFFRKQELQQTPQRDVSYLPTFLRHDNSPHKKSPVRNEHPSTLFSGLDPDGGSLALSFLNVAASTQKPTQMLVKSPDNDHSLVERVFHDFPAPDFESSRNTLFSDNMVERLRDEMRPTDYLVELEERLRSSEQRREQVNQKLDQLQHST